MRYFSCTNVLMSGFQEGSASLNSHPWSHYGKQRCRELWRPHGPLCPASQGREDFGALFPLTSSWSSGSVLCSFLYSLPLGAPPCRKPSGLSSLRCVPWVPTPPCAVPWQSPGHTAPARHSPPLPTPDSGVHRHLLIQDKAWPRAGAKKVNKHLSE